MTISSSATRTFPASKEAVWSVLADFGNIARWTDSVRTSDLTGEAEDGLGATRHCALAPLGTVEEEIVEWVPGERLGIQIGDTTKLPMKSALTTFSLVDNGDGTTTVTMASEVKPRGGLAAGLVGRRLEKGLPRAAGRLLDDLGAEASRVSADA